MKYTILGIVLLFYPCSSYSNEKLEELFNPEVAKKRLKQMDSALSSFSKLTRTILHKSNLGTDYDTFVIPENRIPDDAQIKVSLKGSDLKNEGNFNWAEQHIGFPNWVKYVTGYIEYLEYKSIVSQLTLARSLGKPKNEIDILKLNAKRLELKLIDEYLSERSWVD